MTAGKIQLGCRHGESVILMPSYLTGIQHTYATHLVSSSSVSPKDFIHLLFCVNYNPG